ncbi:MAG: hypothetical protein LBI20_02950 [Holosporales bacterium]|jgi:hypothetical protein|nr:hypothetical protein [Holosporales bacterium]
MPGLQGVISKIAVITSTVMLASLAQGRERTPVPADLTLPRVWGDLVTGLGDGRLTPYEFGIRAQDDRFLGGIAVWLDRSTDLLWGKRLVGWSSERRNEILYAVEELSGNGASFPGGDARIREIVAELNGLSLALRRKFGLPRPRWEGLENKLQRRHQQFARAYKNKRQRGKTK